MSARLTAETVTDEQIRELLATLSKERSDPAHPSYDKAHGLFGHGADVPACWDALNRSLDKSHAEHRTRCRARCAELLNARAAKTGGAE